MKQGTSLWSAFQSSASQFDEPVVLNFTCTLGPPGKLWKILTLGSCPQRFCFKQSEVQPGHWGFLKLPRWFEDKIENHCRSTTITTKMGPCSTFGTWGKLLLVGNCSTHYLLSFLDHTNLTNVNFILIAQSTDISSLKSHERRIIQKVIEKPLSSKVATGYHILTNFLHKHGH